jgi:hypothetical protein
MNAWPSLVRGLRAVSRGRLFVRPASAPTLPAVEESPEAEPVIEQTPSGGIGPDELLALDRKFEKALRKSRGRPSRRPVKEDAAS